MINPEIASNPVTINGFTIERQALDATDKSLRRYASNQDRLVYLRKRLPLITQESAAPADGMPRGSEISNPTLAKAEKLIVTQDEINALDTWLEAVENVRARLSDEQKALADILYFLPSTEQERDMAELARALHISKRETYNRKNETLLEFWLVLRGEAAWDACTNHA